MTSLALVSSTVSIDFLQRFNYLSFLEQRRDLLKLKKSREQNGVNGARGTPRTLY
jgi:hypothetical protein